MQQTFLDFNLIFRCLPDYSSAGRIDIAGWKSGGTESKINKNLLQATIVTYTYYSNQFGVYKGNDSHEWVSRLRHFVISRLQTNKTIVLRDTALRVVFVWNVLI